MPQTERTCWRCFGKHPGVSCYWAHHGKTADSPKRTDGRTYTVTTGQFTGVYCNECCNGDRCDDPSHFDRESCPYCYGTGKIAELPEVIHAAD